MKRLTLDLGCGSYPRGDVNLDLQFSYRHPLDEPWKFDEVVGGKAENPDLVMADANYPLPFRDESFTCVIMRDVLEHLLNPYNTLREVHRVLKRGGVLKVTVPNARVSLADWRDETHLYSFTEPTIRRLIGRLFRVEKCKLLFNNEVIYVEARKVG